MIVMVGTSVAQCLPPCDTGNTCVSAECIGTTCVETILPGTCFIDGICLNDGDVSVDSCLICNSTATQSEWSPVAGTCFIDETCYLDGKSNAFDPCLICDSTNNPRAWTLDCPLPDPEYPPCNGDPTICDTLPSPPIGCYIQYCDPTDLVCVTYPALSGSTCFNLERDCPGLCDGDGVCIVSEFFCPPPPTPDPCTAVNDCTPVLDPLCQTVACENNECIYTNINDGEICSVECDTVNRCNAGVCSTFIGKCAQPENECKFASCVDSGPGTSECILINEAPGTTCNPDPVCYPDGPFQCSSGVCQISGSVLDCDDSDVCTTDSCDNGACVHTPIPSCVISPTPSPITAPTPVATPTLSPTPTHVTTPTHVATPTSVPTSTRTPTPTSITTPTPTSIPTYVSQPITPLYFPVNISIPVIKPLLQGRKLSILYL